MTVIITDAGFGTEDWTAGYTALEDIAAGTTSVDVPSDARIEQLEDFVAGLTMVRIDFPSFADGRGFTLAKRLRQIGYSGRLRAKGHVICEQYTMARRVGFDEVEISDELAQRQPEDKWETRSNWRDNDYQARLRA